MCEPRCWISIVLMCVASAVAQQGNQVYLNEFLASNGAVLADAQGQYDDWIELYNAGPSAVDIGGMFLTDDIDEPTRWRIPNDRPELTVIPAGGYVLIWADGDTDDAGLHASFKFSSGGEEIALFDADGATLIDRIIFNQQRGNVSFGRTPDGGPDWAFMITPTPGVANAEAYVGIVDDVRFSVEHGFFTEPFIVTLTTETPDAEIWYTLDSTTPRRNADGLFEATLYDQAIPVDGSTVIRAVAVKSGWKDSTLSSQTYIFFRDAQWQMYNGLTAVFPDAEDDPAQVDMSDDPIDPNIETALQALPSICLVAEPNDFFDRKTGIYVNTMKRGIEWERPVSVEWIDPETGLSFQVNAGVRIHGGDSRVHGAFGRMPSKQSLRLLFKADYGPAQLEVPLFPDTEVTRFDALVLRGTLSDSFMRGYPPQYLRDQFSRDTMRDMGCLTPYGCPVHVYINGCYWGLYILVERPDDGFAVAHLGGSKDQYDIFKPMSVLDTDPGELEVVAGDLEAWETLLALVGAGCEEQASYEMAQAYVDIPSFIDYMLMIFYIGSIDGPLGVGDFMERNYWAIRPRETPGGFVFLAWDLEYSLRDLEQNRVSVMGPEGNLHYLFHRLAAHPDFCMSVADRAYNRFFVDGALTPARIIERYQLRAADIEQAMLPEALRWSGETDSLAVDGVLSRWYHERDRLVEIYFPARGDIVVEQLREAGVYPEIDPPVLEVDGLAQHGGVTRAGASLALVNPNAVGCVYYTTNGTDPRTFGQIDSGTTAGQVASAAPLYTEPIALTQSHQIKARVWDDGRWSPLVEATFDVGPGRAGCARSQ